MADYLETTVTGKTWRRAVRVVCDNPLGGTPTVNFVLQDVIKIDGVPTFKDAGNLYDSLTVENAFEPIQLIDPTIDAIVGTITRAEIHAAIYSLFKHLTP